MSKAGKLLIRITVTGILFLLLTAGSASALRQRTLTAGCPSVCGERITAVWNKDGLNLTLFLPGCWDMTKITLEMEDTEKFILVNEGVEFLPGEEADLSAYVGRKVKMRNSDNVDRGYLTIHQGSKIPALFLTVDAGELRKVNRSKSDQITQGRAVFAEENGTVSYDGELAQLKGRGNNSFRYSKKPYQFKLAQKASLGGMNRAKTWILLADWTDASMLRNRIVLDMSREIGLRNAVSCAHTDVWINGTYNGLYLLTEKIQIGKNRIPITDLEEETEKVNADNPDPGKLTAEQRDDAPLFRAYSAVKDPEDITGGYIVTVEKHHRLRDSQLPGFRTPEGMNIRIKEPTTPSTRQAEYLLDLFTSVQLALAEDNGIDPKTGKRYDELLDLTSFAQRFLIEEWSQNYDIFGGSQYMYKDSDLVDPKIYAGPSWDYDLSFGNMQDRGKEATGVYATSFHRKSNLYWTLYAHEEFRQKVAEIWLEKFLPAIQVLTGETPAPEGSVLRSLDGYREQIEASVKLNVMKWGVPREATAGKTGNNFFEAVSFLKRRIAQRTAWMVKTYGGKE